MYFSPYIDPHKCFSVFKDRKTSGEVAQQVRALAAHPKAWGSVLNPANKPPTTCLRGSYVGPRLLRALHTHGAQTCWQSSHAHKIKMNLFNKTKRKTGGVREKERVARIFSVIASGERKS